MDCTITSLADAPELRQAARDLFKAVQVKPDNNERLFEACVTSDGRVVGASTVGLYDEDPDDGDDLRRPRWTFSVAVADAFRRKGIARTLTQSIIDAHPREKVLLEGKVVNPHMAALLKQVGFYFYDSELEDEEWTDHERSWGRRMYRPNPRGEIVYHGSDESDLDELHSGTPPYAGGLGHGVYVTRLPETAAFYGRHVYSAKLLLDDEQILDLSPENWRHVDGLEGHSILVGEQVSPFSFAIGDKTYSVLGDVDSEWEAQVVAGRVSREIRDILGGMLDSGPLARLDEDLLERLKAHFDDGRSIWTDPEDYDELVVEYLSDAGLISDDDIASNGIDPLPEVHAAKVKPLTTKIARFVKKIEADVKNTLGEQIELDEIARVAQEHGYRAVYVEGIRSNATVNDELLVFDADDLEFVGRLDEAEVRSLRQRRRNPRRNSDADLRALERTLASEFSEENLLRWIRGMERAGRRPEIPDHVWPGIKKDVVAHPLSVDFYQRTVAATGTPVPFWLRLASEFSLGPKRAVELDKAAERLDSDQFLKLIAVSIGANRVGWTTCDHCDEFQLDVARMRDPDDKTVIYIGNLSTEERQVVENFVGYPIGDSDYVIASWPGLMERHEELAACRPTGEEEENDDLDEAEVLRAFPYSEHEGLSVVQEHGSWWVTCAPCGAQWSVHETTGPAGFHFEQASEGDHSCEESGS